MSLAQKAGDFKGNKTTELAFETGITFSHFSLQSLKKVFFLIKAKSHSHFPLGFETPRKSKQIHSMVRGGAATHSELLKCTNNLVDRHTDRIWNLQSPQILLVKIRVADSFVTKLQVFQSCTKLCFYHCFLYSIQF